MRNQDVDAPTVIAVPGGRFGSAVFIVVLFSGALYFGRAVLEPVAFVIFAVALVEPFLSAAEARVGKPLALVLTILLTLVVLSLFVLAIAWSISDIAHWGIANVERLQSLYARATTWFAQYNLFIGDLTNLSSSSIAGIFRTVAGQVNSFLGFALVVLLSLAFGLVEMDTFKSKLAVLDERMGGWSLLKTCSRIAERLRKYMLIRTVASLATGVAVFIFTLSIGLDLAFAWGVISFVLNYIPYIGTVVATILPVVFATAQFESWQSAAIIFGCLYLIQFVIGSYLEPVLTGNALSISPFVMLFAFLLWDFLWGMPGAFIGLPVTIALFTIWEQNPSTRWIAELMSKWDGAAHKRPATIA